MYHRPELLFCFTVGEQPRCATRGRRQRQKRARWSLSLALLGGMSAFSIYANRIAALRAREGHEADAYFVANRELDTSSTFLNLLSPMCAGLIAVLLPVRTSPILNASRPCS